MTAQHVILETERLILREFLLTDAANFFDLNNDPEVIRYTGDEPFETLGDAEELIRNYSAYTESGFGRWTVVLKETGEILGWCGLRAYPHEEFVDLGYRFHQKYWGKGYATESAQACLNYGFKDLNLDTIIGRSATDNTGSIKVLEKIGMKFWKNAPCEHIDNSSYFRIDKSDYHV